MCVVDNRLRRLAVHAGDADIEPRRERVDAVAAQKVDFGVERGFGRQNDPALAGRHAHCLLEAG